MGSKHQALGIQLKNRGLANVFEDVSSNFWQALPGVLGALEAEGARRVRRPAGRACQKSLEMFFNAFAKPSFC